jgi:plastocyanin
MAKKKPARKRGRLRGNATVMLGGLALVAVIALFGVYAFSGGGDSKRSRAPLRQPTVVTAEKQVSVEIVDKDYTPRDLKVPVGATITFDNTGELPHTVTDDRGAFDSKIVSSGDSWSRTFDSAGIFYYYCTLHHGMLGTLTVQ